jgi:predicted nucleic acid-binding protein
MTAEELQSQINALMKQLQSLQEELVELDNDKHIKTKDKKSIKLSSDNSKVELLIVPDTSWLVAVIDENDSHHVSAESSLGALLPYQPSFHVPIMAFMETISRLIRVNKMSVKKAQEKTLKFVGKRLHAKGASTTFNVENILEKYKIYSRIKIKSLTTIDFFIVTEGIGLNAKILTCDLKMYRAAKKYYKHIYFMTDKVEKQKSDLARLIFGIQSQKNN